MPRSCVRRMRVRASSSVDDAAALEVDGVLAVLTGREMAADGLGDLPCGWLVKSKDGTDMQQPPHPPLAAERCNYVGEPYGVVIATTLAAAREGADAVMTDFEELEAVVSAADATKSAQIYDNVPGESQLSMGTRRQSRHRRRVCARRARDEARHHQQPADSECARTARGDRRVRTQQRIVHAVHHESESAPRAARAVGVREARAGTQAAHRRARRRRRLRFEDLHLSGRNDRGVGVASHRTAGEVDGGSFRIVPVRCARSRSRDARGTRARRAGSVSRFAREDDREPRRVSVDVRIVRADVPLRHAAGRAISNAGDPRRGRRRVHEHRAGGRVSRRRPSRGDVRGRTHRRNRRARTEDRSDGAAPSQLHSTEGFSVSNAGCARVRHRRLRSEPEQGAGTHRLRRISGAQSARRRRAGANAASASRVTSKRAASRRRNSPPRSAPASACTKAAKCA